MLKHPQGTVGAGLPVIGTLKHLVETGDKVEKVEGVFSGTLSYIFNCFGDGRPFSEVVADAKVNGYTEPDPRDDLNGTDVARKVRGRCFDLYKGMCMNVKCMPQQSWVGCSVLATVCRLLHTAHRVL